MKALQIVFALMMFPLAASACPNLVGSYECTEGGSALLTISEEANGFDIAIGHFFSGIPGAAQGGSYFLSKVGGSSNTLEGVGETSLTVNSTCEGDTALVVQGSFDDAVAGHTDLVTRYTVDERGNVLKNTMLVFAGGANRQLSQFCGRR